MARKATEYVQFKLRIRESLRRKIERAALKEAHSANAEAVKRLEHTFDEEEHWEQVQRDMEEQRDEIDARQRAYYEEEALKEAQFEASLRDTKILNMMVANQTDSAKLLRLIAFELEMVPRWAETPETKKMLADRMRYLILNNDYPPNEYPPHALKEHSE